MTQLNVPYRSQWAADARTHGADCGPACLAMILNAFGIVITPDGVYDFIDTPKGYQDFTNYNELMDAGADNGITFTYKKYLSQWQGLPALKKLIDAGQPAIALIKYEKWRSFTGNWFDYGHFVVVVGYDADHVYVHDPLFGHWKKPATLGESLKVPNQLFLDGWGGFPPSENPNFVCAYTNRSLATSGPTPVQPEEIKSTTPTAAVAIDLTDEMMRRIKALAAYIGAAPPDLTDDSEVSLWTTHIGDWGEETNSHTVQSGDTLLGIAAHFYNDGGRWRAIQAFNELPNEMIFVGQQLQIPLPGSSNAHQNQALLDNVQFAAMSGEVEPAAALDYNALGVNTFGMGFVETEEQNTDDGFE